eukprot:CAMPEP_0183734882 /NCGR_PEP_ID=MMETSP0737-20130205/45033_1 /TAXON_ID=385413 /ORGANISM="Thalassiosira miniscula, Strain CCMP1093" /LENGTH=804 /DNA_ID=CAMNT_0025968495 /DNA_START=326 /DNA_END=2740 /DNA_ORIENTATION=+
MPALVLCGYRSKLGGDDLSPICIINTSMRIAELILLIPACIATFDEYEERLDEECMGRRTHLNRVGILPLPYLVVSVIFAVFTICLSIRLYQVSGRGSPTEPERRKGIGRLFACMVILTPAGLTMLAVVGIIGVTFLDSRLRCVGHPGSKPTWFHLLITILCFQSLEVLIYGIFLWNWIKFELQRRIIAGAPKTIESKAEEWDNSCKCCCKYTALFCCFSFGGKGIKDEDFSSMATVLAELFDDGGTLDIVGSDVYVACMAIAMEQEEEKRRCIERLKMEAGDDPDVLSLLDQATTSNAVTLPASVLAIFNVAVTRDIESGMSANSKAALSLPFYTNSNNNKKEDRERAFIFKRTQNKESEKFAIRELLSSKLDIDRYAIAEGARFLRYSIAINTAKGYLFNESTNCCRLAYARCCEMPKHNQRAGEGVIDGDDIGGLHEAALMKVIGFDKSKVELHYAHVGSTVTKAVYCIVVDHVWKSVVLCVRGSLSLDDYVINLQVDPENLSELGTEYGFDGNGEYCHAGYLARAKWICEDLKRHNILDRLLNKETGKYREGYILRVTGHSLGAGTAAPLAIMLRSQYPNLRCLCFAPPGGLFSKGLATRSQSFVTTYVLNTDLVPRISTRTVERLRDEVLQMIPRIKVSKRQLVRIHKSGKKFCELQIGLEDLLYDIDDIPDSSFKAQLDQFKRVKKESPKSNKIPLYPPGKFIHLVKTMSSQEQRVLQQGRFMLSDLFNCFTCDRFVLDDKYAPRYCTMNDFDDIIISSTLISDHMVETVESAFMFTADAFGVDPSEPPPPIPEMNGN